MAQEHGLAQRLMAREFGDTAFAPEHAAKLRALDEAIEMQYTGKVGQIYMYGSQIVTDPLKAQISVFEGVGANDIARLFLLNGLHLPDGSVLPYDPDNSVIAAEHAWLANEIRTLLYPATFYFHEEAEHFETQKKFLLQMLSEMNETSAPFPSGRYISELIGVKYHENVLPLTLPAEPAPATILTPRGHGDYLHAVLIRQAFDNVSRDAANFCADLPFTRTPEFRDAIAAKMAPITRPEDAIAPKL